jgi:hypothetical protein
MKNSALRNPGFLSPGDTVDGFRIMERLSSGGFGVVYHVMRQGRSYALKFALRQAASGPHDKKHIDERMGRELGCMVRMHHPGIVRAFCHARWPTLEDGYFYIAMEYVRGDTLRVWAARHRPTMRQALRLFVMLADALDAAHQQGILHRDLKPANILVRPTGQPVIVDWGAGDFPLAGPLTQDHLPPGTPAYRSPESLRSARLHANELGTRYEFQPTDDLYSLGVCFYELLTGKSPFFHAGLERARLDAEIELRIPTPPHDVQPGVPLALSGVVMRLLSKEPRYRHASAEALKRDLASLDDGSAVWEALLPTPEGWEEPELPAEAGPPRTPLKRWWGLGLAACIGTVALVAGAYALWKRDQPVAARPAQTAEAPNASMDAVPLLMLPGTFPTPAPQEKAPLMNTAAVASTAPAPSPSRPPKNKEKFRQWCLGATLTMAMSAGCAGVQRMPGAEDCPPEAIAAMRKQGWLISEYVHVLLDVRNPRPPGDFYVIHRPGEVVGRVLKADDPHDYPPGWKPVPVPEGTLLYGRVWMGDPEEGAFYFRYYEAKPPNGPRIPVCFTSRAQWKQGSDPDAPAGPAQYIGFFADHFPVGVRPLGGQ